MDDATLLPQLAAGRLGREDVALTPPPATLVPEQARILRGYTGADMMRTIGRLLLCGVFLVAAGHGAPIVAQETRTMKAGEQSPPARLEDLAWLQGAWEGPGISGPATEVYSAPAGGQIVGHFRQVRGDGVWFYEIMTIVQVGASLEYRLKHFNQDLTGWEEKGQVVKFPLVAVEKDVWYFDGLTVRRDGPDGMVGAVRIDNKDGPPREAVFRYRRVK